LQSGRSSGQNLRIRFKRFAHLEETLAGIGYEQLMIFLHKSESFNPLKGNLPQTNAYRTTPSAHTSAFFPQYSILEIISGAIYASVPHDIFSLVAEQILNPKSIILIDLLESSMRILSSLMSLCRMFF